MAKANPSPASQSPLHTLGRRAKMVGRFFVDHPFITATLLCLIYLVAFQTSFVLSGDNWAETYYEYVHGAVVNGAREFFEPGIAGYYNLLPKLLVYPYILWGFPIEGIEHFLRISVILFTVGCIAFIAHKSNHYLIKSNWIRIATALLVLLTYYHISSFSLINVWYVGFIPILLVSLNPSRIGSQFKLVLYTLFVVAVCLTKPSIIMLPFILYWTWRHKEYLAGIFMSLAVAFQTLLFFASEYYESSRELYPDHASLVTKAVSSLAYPGLLLLKHLQIPPLNLVMLGMAGLVLIAMIILIARYRGVIVAGGIILLTGLAAYTALYPPDAGAMSLLADGNYKLAFEDAMKLQRELTLTFLIVLSIGICLDILRQKVKNTRLSASLIIITVALLFGMSFRPIDVNASGTYVNLDPFKQTLASGEAVCMPITPTPSWDPYKDGKTAMYGWYYESRKLGSCAKTNYGLPIDYAALESERLGAGKTYRLKSPDQNVSHISSFYVAVSNPTPNIERQLTLTNDASGKTYVVTLKAKQSDDRLTFVAFDLTREPDQPGYSYTLREAGADDSELSLGTFTNGQDLQWSYYITRATLR